jgi:predicted MFS family arabinose efflux permease
VSRMAGPRVQRRGTIALLEGCGVQAIGLVILGTAVATGIPLGPAPLAALLVVFGIGQAMVMAPLYGLVLSKVPPAHAGSGGGVMMTVQQIGNGSGVAVVGTLYYAVQAADSASTAFVAALAILAIAVALTASFIHALGRPSIELR